MTTLCLCELNDHDLRFFAELAAELATGREATGGADTSRRTARLPSAASGRELASGTAPALATEATS